MKVYIGFDEHEEAAAEVARKSLCDVTGDEVEPEFLCRAKLEAHGLLRRLSDDRGGQTYDLVSNAPQSTEFAASRFLTPLLCQQGYALFVDCDVVFLRDPRTMMFEVTSQHAVSVVQHGNVTSTQWKMQGQRQVDYTRKNWSSVALYNCDHPANRRLSLRDVNERPGRDLHRFYWLADNEIGSLDPRWNVLIGIQEIPHNPGILHYTLGGPFTSGWAGGPHDDLWLAAAKK